MITSVARDTNPEKKIRLAGMKSHFFVRGLCNFNANRPIMLVCHYPTIQEQKPVTGSCCGFAVYHLLHRVSNMRHRLVAFVQAALCSIAITGFIQHNYGLMLARMLHFI